MGIVRILSYKYRIFRNRIEAAKLLAEELKGLSKNVIVLGVPRGGVIIAAEIAKILSAQFDIVLSRKIGAPENSELAIGAISEDGHVFLDELADYVDERHIQEEKIKQLVEIKRRSNLYRGIIAKLSLIDKIVVVTDDGAATGATLHAALLAINKEKPEKLIAAIPVGPRETIEKLARYADEIICLCSPPGFSAVGQFYNSFEQIEDEEIMNILRHGNRG